MCRPLGERRRGGPRPPCFVRRRAEALTGNADPPVRGDGRGMPGDGLTSEGLRGLPVAPFVVRAETSCRIAAEVERFSAFGLPSW